MAALTSWGSPAAPLAPHPRPQRSPSLFVTAPRATRVASTGRFLLSYTHCTLSVLHLLSLVAPTPYIIQDAFPLQLPRSIDVAEKETG